ncbi:DUF7288 family protein [Halopiger xanaduensis]|uniref:Uncharacterized protein n=1 Tax=Halopiger xanaduensis (strain DSM 18323 / JCM 14033 / SH-6) TaxID=797210 RepID=F8D8Z5_HALXS|nr:hypothetical protein [Halopiger xanaduensis]AEH37182.1 hypothetical protein Halxa_2564 [Halopiger xanaduensis SH-6]
MTDGTANRNRDDLTRDRAQAYTLEGFIGAMIVLMAVLFALQSAVITPTTGGLADRTVQEQLQQETQDALVVAAANETGNLSYTLRYWEEDDDEIIFNGTDQPGPDGEQVYSEERFGNFTLGQIFDDRLTETGRSYNVELHYENGTGGELETTHLVYQGSPPSNAQTASYIVTLYDDQPVTGTDEYANLSEAEESGTPPIPEHPDTDDTGAGSDSALYNVVEVRVIVW